MARKLTTGFETGVLADELDAVSGGSINAVTVRTGGYSWYCYGVTVFGTLNFPGGALSEFYMGFGINVPAGKAMVIRFRDALSQDALVWSWLASGVIRVTSNGTNTDSVNAYSQDAWHYVEIRFKFDDAGVIQVKIDGTQIINYSGDTSQPGYTAPLLAYFNPANSNGAYFDDIVLNDTTTSYNNSWPGQPKLYPVRPGGVGDVTGLSRGGVDTGANWDQVDEVPATATSFVYGTVADVYDLYAHGTVVLPADYECSNVIVVNDAYVDSGAGKVTGVVKSVGGESSGEDHTLNGSAHAYSDAFPLRPDGGAWTQADIDDFQAGPKVR